MNKKIIYIFFLSGLLCSFKPQFIFSQQVNVSVNKNKILIGEQFVYNLSVTIPKMQAVDFYAIPDSLEGFEVITRSKIDTANKIDSATYRQRIVFTSFDSGHYLIPSFTLADNVYTDTIAMDIGYLADTSKTIRDIKPILDPVEKKIKWYYFLIAGLLLLAVLYAIIRYFFKRKKNVPVTFKSKIPPYEVAMKALKELELSENAGPDEIKKYHAVLSDIFKTYYSGKLRNDITTKTTSAILLQLKNNEINSTELGEAAASLRCNDAVKFAKFIPERQQSQLCFAQVKNFIQHLENLYKN